MVTEILRNNVNYFTIKKRSNKLDRFVNKARDIGNGWPMLLYQRHGFVTALGAAPALRGSADQHPQLNCTELAERRQKICQHLTRMKKQCKRYVQ